MIKSNLTQNPYTLELQKGIADLQPETVRELTVKEFNFNQENK